MPLPFPASELARRLRLLLADLDKEQSDEDALNILNAVEDTIKVYRRAAKQKPRATLTPAIFFWEYWNEGEANIPVWGCKFCQGRWISPNPGSCPFCGPRTGETFPTPLHCQHCAKPFYAYGRAKQCPFCNKKVTIPKPKEL